MGGLLSWMITCSVTEGGFKSGIRSRKRFSGFSLAAATSNDPLAAGNIAATLVITISLSLFNFLVSLFDRLCLYFAHSGHYNLQPLFILPSQISLVVTVVVSKMKPDEKSGWRLTQSIINPLTPWIATFEKELKVALLKKTYLMCTTIQVKEAPMWHWIPDTEEIIDTFKNWFWVAIATTVGFFVVIYLGLPLVMTSDRLSLSGIPVF